MDALLVIVVLLVVCAVVGWPLWHGTGQAEARDADRIADLVAAKEAKYREIRELELDHRTGKLSDQDFRALDRQLRGEAVAILHELDTLGGDEPATLSEP